MAKVERNILSTFVVRASLPLPLPFDGPYHDPGAARTCPQPLAHAPARAPSSLGPCPVIGEPTPPGGMEGGDRIIEPDPCGEAHRGVSLPEEDRVATFGPPRSHRHRKTPGGRLEHRMQSGA